MLTFVFQAGCELDPVDKNKTTPLHLAAKYGNEKTASLLVERGASLKQVNSDGHNALTIAILHGKRFCTVARVITRKVAFQ